jgi:CheY-like chemotaxis protein
LLETNNSANIRNGKNRRILIVDDEPDVTLTLKTVLENNGYALDAFNDSVMALENFKRKATAASASNADLDIVDDLKKGEGKYYYYDLVLSDLKMPGMNGFELYQKIREIDKNIKVRFLTASEINYDEFREKVAPTIDDAQNCFIKKPIENQKLLNVVNELMK